MQVIARGERGVGGFSVEIPITSQDFDETLGAYVDSLTEFFEQHLPQRMADIAWETMIEGNELASQKNLRRVTDKKALRAWILRHQTRQFNERWEMRKGSKDELSRDEFLQDIAEAIRRLKSNEKPTMQKLAEILDCSVTALHKQRRKHRIQNWNVVLHLARLRVPS